MTLRSNLKVKVMGQGHQVKNVISGLNSYLYRPMDRGQSHMGQGQRSPGSRSKVTWVKVSQALKIMVGGLTSTPSCFIFWSPLKKIWVPKRSQRFTNYCPVNFYLVRIFVTTDRQTDRQTDTKQCLRAHCAWAQVGSIKAHVMALSSIVILWLTA